LDDFFWGHSIFVVLWLPIPYVGESRQHRKALERQMVDSEKGRNRLVRRLCRAGLFCYRPRQSGGCNLHPYHSGLLCRRSKYVIFLPTTRASGRLILRSHYLATCITSQDAAQLPGWKGQASNSISERGGLTKKAGTRR